MSIDLKCSWCNSDFNIPEAEYNRQVRNGRIFFFCSRSCAAKKNNASRPGKRIPVKKICPHCKNEFTTMTGSKSATFCSRSCASGSMTEKRREAQRSGGKEKAENLISAQKTLLLREAWKYTQLKSFLEYCKEKFEFEYRLGNYVYDLALPEKLILIEFDGMYHGGKKQSKTDHSKDLFASQSGWKVIRRKVQNNTIINPDILYDIIN